MTRSRKSRRDHVPGGVLIGILLGAFALLLLLSFGFAREGRPPLDHPLSVVGHHLAHWSFHFGLGRLWSFIFPLLLFQLSWRLLKEDANLFPWARAWRQLIFVIAATLSTATLIQIRGMHETSFGGGWWTGVWAVEILSFLVRWAGAPGTILLILTLDLIVLALVFHWHPGRSLQVWGDRMETCLALLKVRFGDWRRRRKLAALERRSRKAEQKQQRTQRNKQPAPERVEPPADPDLDASGTVIQGHPETTVSTNDDLDTEIADGPQAVDQDEFDVTQETIEREKRFKAKSKIRGYKPPSVDLLNNPPDDEYHVTEEDMKLYSELLVNCLRDFNLETRVVHVHPGPVITRYDLEPAPGVKVSRIAGLADDLALKLKAERIRIIAPVPGKGAVGVELPNKVRNTVFIKSIFNTEKFIKADSPLTVALGKTSSGEAAVADLRAMPHILVAGQTGSGKSVCVNGIICSILLRAHPAEVQFVLIDPKMIELSDYRRIADQFIAKMDGIDGDVVTDPQDAVRVLSALEIEMDNRYRYLSETGYRSIQEFNEALESGEVEKRIRKGDLEFANRPEDDPVPDRMVYLVVIIDELADLMMTAGKEIEISIARLAQKARAVGIHLVVATQRPSVDVLTGLIKANFPARIAFAVRQKVDSKTIIDSMGADQLLGRGDMLYLASGSPEPVRMHNALITGKEIRALLDHIRRQPRDQATFRLPGLPSEETMAVGGVDGDRDELFWDAAEQVVLSRQGSVSVLQRRLRIGHSRASRLIDQLEQAGVVGPFDGSKARQVLVDELWLEENR